MIASTLFSAAALVVSFANAGSSSSSSNPLTACSGYPCVTKVANNSINFRSFNTPKTTCSTIPTTSVFIWSQWTESQILTTGGPSASILPVGACNENEAAPGGIYTLYGLLWSGSCGPDGPYLTNSAGNNAAYLTYCYENCYGNAFCEATGGDDGFSGGCGCAPNTSHSGW